MFDLKEIERLYDEGKSVREIAACFNTYPNKIARALKKTGKESAPSSSFSLLLPCSLSLKIFEFKIRFVQKK